jgi:hypothetical protein
MKLATSYLHVRVTSAERFRLRGLAMSLGPRGSISQLMRYLAGFDPYPVELLHELKHQLPSSADPNDNRTGYVYVQIRVEERQQLLDEQRRDAAQTRHPKPLSHHLRVRVGLTTTSAWAQAAGFAASKRVNRPVLSPDDLGLYLAALTRSREPGVTL